MFYVNTFRADGRHKFGRLSTLLVYLKTLHGVKARILDATWLDDPLGYEITQVPDSTPYAPGKVVYRSDRARELFGEASPYNHN